MGKEPSHSLQCCWGIHTDVTPVQRICGTSLEGCLQGGTPWCVDLDLPGQTCRGLCHCSAQRGQDQETSVCAPRGTDPPVPLGEEEVLNWC